MGDFSKFVGIPWRAEDNGIAGTHCWGLVRLVFSALGKDLPSYDVVRSQDMIAIARTIGRDSLLMPWAAIDKPKAFDVVLMGGAGKARRVPVHVGIMLNNKQLLHVEEHTESVLVPLNHWSVAGRILSFYRHTQL